MSRISPHSPKPGPGFEEAPLAEHERSDAELSALLDGELSREEEAALRERMANDPALAERFAALARVDAQLRGLTGPGPSADRLASMRRGLAERIAAEPDHTTPAAIAKVVPLRRFRRPVLGVAVAIAAGLTLYLAVGPSPESVPDTEMRSRSDEWAARDTGTDELQLAGLSDEELAIVIEYETLADYDVIENLDLLEVLLLLDEAEPM